jgi:aryl-alcohol dehydrogenase-like predicted oxidoreductase
MRYRPFGISGKAVSAVSLALTRGGGPSDAAGWRSVMFQGMEHGVNCFDIECGNEALARGVAQALQAVERRLVFLICTLRADSSQPFTVERLAESLKRTLTLTGAGYFDVVMFDAETYAALTPRARTLLARLHDASLVLQLGVTGDAAGVDAAVRDPEIEVLSTAYNLTSDSYTRRILREASSGGMTVVGYNPVPQSALQPPAKPKPLLGGKRERERHNPLQGVGTYAFLHTTSGWKAEELCLAYALTEPSLATLQIDMSQLGLLESLAAVPERDAPTSLGAQVEMARFGGENDAGRSAAPGVA